MCDDCGLADETGQKAWLAHKNPHTIILDTQNIKNAGHKNRGFACLYERGNVQVM